MRLIWWLAALPVGIAIIALSVLNRHAVTLHYWLPGVDTTDAGFSMPVFVIIFICLIAGFLLGAGVMWFNQHHWRRDARRAKKEADKWHLEADRRQDIIEKAEKQAVSGQIAHNPH